GWRSRQHRSPPPRRRLVGPRFLPRARAPVAERGAAAAVARCAAAHSRRPGVRRMGAPTRTARPGV
ncbi:MAG: hypothetical protein AVDCRST_MAG04-2440, partial [uncultured Acetobacteraceae bacterium]